MVSDMRERYMVGRRVWAHSLARGWTEAAREAARAALSAIRKPYQKLREAREAFDRPYLEARAASKKSMPSGREPLFCS
jgi:hypothetical protein